MMKWELLWPGTAPFVSTLCLPTVTTHDQISEAIFTYSTANIQRFEVGAAWERGYMLRTNFTLAKHCPEDLLTKVCMPAWITRHADWAPPGS